MKSSKKKSIVALCLLSGVCYFSNINVTEAVTVSVYTGFIIDSDQGGTKAYDSLSVERYNEDNSITQPTAVIVHTPDSEYRYHETEVVHGVLLKGDNHNTTVVHEATEVPNVYSDKELTKLAKEEFRRRWNESMPIVPEPYDPSEPVPEPVPVPDPSEPSVPVPNPVPVIDPPEPPEPDPMPIPTPGPVPPPELDDNDFVIRNIKNELAEKYSNAVREGDKSRAAGTFTFRISDNPEFQTVTAQAYKVGNKTYINNAGINANDKKITNVADGIVAPGSTDAVNGGQLYEVANRITLDSGILDKIAKLGDHINKVGAGASALTGLHPLDYDANNKFNLAVAGGFYKNEQALALGAFYRPNEDVMFNVSTTIGNNDNLYNVGASLKVGEGSINKDLKARYQADPKGVVKALEAEVATLQAENVEMKAQLKVLLEKAGL